jgi:hypothetical protein
MYMYRARGLVLNVLETHMWGKENKLFLVEKVSAFRLRQLGIGSVTLGIPEFLLHGDV